MKKIFFGAIWILVMVSVMLLSGCTKEEPLVLELSDPNEKTIEEVILTEHCTSLFKEWPTGYRIINGQKVEFGD